MAPSSVDNIKRQIAGELCYAFFHIVSTTGSQVSNLILRKYSKGLTPKEKLIAQALSEDLHQLANTSRALAWRLTDTPGSRKPEVTARLVKYLRSDRVRFS